MTAFSTGRVMGMSESPAASRRAILSAVALYDLLAE